MPVNVLTLCDFEEHDFRVVAIHTVLQDYKLAYLLNRNLGFQFKKLAADLDFVIAENKAYFSAYEYHDAKRLIDWGLVRNKFKIKAREGNSLGLFHTEASFASTYVYLQPEIKEADFVLKIQGDIMGSKMREILQKINNTEGVITAYSVNNQQLNHKEYLIF